MDLGDKCFAGLIAAFVLFMAVMLYFEATDPCRSECNRSHTEEQLSSRWNPGLKMMEPYNETVTVCDSRLVYCKDDAGVEHLQ